MIRFWKSNRLSHDRRVLPRLKSDAVVDTVQRLAENWQRTCDAVAAAALHAGRSADSVQIVAVTKGHAANTIQSLLAAGARQLGESRPQELWQKAAALSDFAGLHWHLIGHLQRNKVRRTLPLVQLIHSVDSERLLLALDQAAAELGKACDVLLEVNPGTDASKTGLPPPQVAGLLETAHGCQWVRVRGLMAMASLDADPQQARSEFESVRRLRDDWAAACRTPHSLNELSMGMSDDFDLAIAAGATIVRIGSRLFEGLTTTY